MSDFICGGRVRRKGDDLFAEEYIYIGRSYGPYDEEAIYLKTIDDCRDKKIIGKAACKEFKENFERVYYEISEPSVIKTERIVFDINIKFPYDGKTISFNLRDLYETLEQIESSDIFFDYSIDQTNFLLFTGVLDSIDGYYGCGARKGINYDFFMSKLEEYMKEYAN